MEQSGTADTLMETIRQCQEYSYDIDNDDGDEDFFMPSESTLKFKMRTGKYEKTMTIDIKGH